MLENEYKKIMDGSSVNTYVFAPSAAIRYRLVVCNTAHFMYHVSPQLSCSIRYFITIPLIVIREMIHMSP